MVWHIVLTLLCLLCIIGSVIFKERFSFLFPEMIIVAFYVMIFSLLLPVMIQRFYSVQDLYIMIVFSFLLLVFIILLINVIKRYLKSKSRDYGQKEGPEAKVNVDNAAADKNQPSLQNVRLKRLILEQRNSLAQKKPALDSKQSLDVVGGEEQNESANKELQPAAKVLEPATGSATEKPIQEKFVFGMAGEQGQASIAQSKIRDEKEGIYNASSVQQRLDQTGKEQITGLAMKGKKSKKQALGIETDKHETYTEQEAYLESEKVPEKKEAVILTVNQKEDHYEKDYQSALYYKDRGSYKKALQVLKKLYDNQLQPERRKRLEIEVLKILAVSGEYREATDEVYMFLSNGYSLNEEENKEIMDILYLLQENA